jgi:hypothetical protein
MPGHHSVGAALRGDGEGLGFVLSTHNDTVPVVDEDLPISDPCSGQK